MFALSHAIQVNPPGIEPVLTRAQVWRGLEMKAEDAPPFVAGMSRCEVVERGGNQLLRDVTFAGGSHRERVTMHAPVQVHFERVGDGGFIENTISDSAIGLLLTFTFGLSFLGTEPGSDEERAQGEAMRDAYVAAVDATLARVRSLVAQGAIS